MNIASQQAGRFVFLDGIRGLAALSVCISHACYTTITHPDKGLDWAWLPAFKRLFHFGVPMFFVLSGFVIAYSLRHATITPRYFGRFVLRRMIRLDPPYWCAILFAMAVTATISRFAGENHRPPSAGAIALHLVYLQTWFDIQPINIVFWTLGIEVQFYLTLVVLWWVAQRTGWSLGALSLPLLAVSLATLSADDTISHWRNYKVSLLPNYGLFYLGTTACLAYLGRGRFWFAKGLAACIARLAFDWNEHLAAGVATAALIDYAGRAGKMSTWLSGPVVQFLGAISYSLYLIHEPIERFISLAVYRIERGGPIGWLGWALGIGVSIAAAWVFYLAIERPSVRLSRRLKVE